MDEHSQGEVASAAHSPPEPAATPAEIRDQVIEQLRHVYDPEIPVNIYELGLIYAVDVDDQGKVSIRMTLTTPMCPAAEMLPPEVETRARSVAGVTGVGVELVWDPPWSPAMMSESAKLELGMV